MTAILLFAQRMKGNEIYDRRGNKLGTIADVMLDGSLTRAPYVVLAFGGSLTTPKKLFAVAPEALTLDTENECFVLDANQQRLAEADGFDPARPPTMADSLFTHSRSRSVRSSDRRGSRATTT